MGAICRQKMKIVDKHRRKIAMHEGKKFSEFPHVAFNSVETGKDMSNVIFSSLTFRKLLHIVTDLIQGKNICAYMGRPLYVVYYFCR